MCRVLFKTSKSQSARWLDWCQNCGRPSDDKDAPGSWSSLLLNSLISIFREGHNDLRKHFPHSTVCKKVLVGTNPVASCANGPGSILTWFVGGSDRGCRCFVGMLVCFVVTVTYYIVGYFVCRFVPQTGC